MNQEVFFSEIATLVKEQPDNVVFFVGAGISINPPSYLPLVKKIRPELIKAICKKEKKTCIDKPAILIFIYPFVKLAL